MYYKGDQSCLKSKKMITVVGSRKMTRYGKEVIARIVPVLVEAGVVIVSGFMYGVDQEAHKVCLESGGKTIAVLGWGIDWQVAEEDVKLERLIHESGLFMSEYKGGARPQLWMFPQRNRVMAKLASGVLVIEAAEKSGSLITADYADKLKKRLFAVPGSITSSVSQGTNWLIQTGKAQMVVRGEDILDSMGWEYPGSDPGHPGSDPFEGEGLTIDEIAKVQNKSVQQVSSELSLLQLRGKVKEEEGKFYKS